MGRAVLVLEGEGTVGGDIGDGGHEAVSCRVLVGVQGTVVAVKGCHIVLVQVATGFVVIQRVHQFLDAGAHALEQRH